MNEDPSKVPVPPTPSPEGSGQGEGQDHWDMYWAHGFVTSCALAFSANYEGRMRGIWEEFFETLEPGARILDICTGNGAIAIIANQVSRAGDRGFEIHGIDSARIDPAATLKGDRTLLEGIHFHASAPVERTSFGDGYFDAVTGQYALEYTDVPQAIGEMARVLRAGARCLFVMHHSDSVVLETGREELRHARLLFEETALFERGRELMRRTAQAATPAERQALAQDVDAEDKRQRLNAAAADVSAAIDRSAHPEMLRGALGALGRAWQAAQDSGLEPALAMLDQAERDIRGNEERLRDLLRAASDAGRIEQILADFHAAGFETQPPTALHHEDAPGSRRLVGWAVRGHR